MNNEEIKLRLSAARPGGQDADDAVIRTAVEAASRDQEIQSWLENERAMDGILCGKLRSLQPPAGLRDQIIAARNVTAQSRRRAWGLGWFVIAAAAAAVLTAAGMLEWISLRDAAPERDAVLAEYRDAVAQLYAQMSQEGYRLDTRDADLTHLATFLAEHRSPTSGTLRDGLQDSVPLGCKVLEWHGHKVSMICFNRGGQVAHLFVINRSALRQPLPSHAATDVRMVAEHPATAWADESHAYVLIGGTADTDLTRFL